MTWDNIYRRACERAGLKDQPVTNEFVQLSDDAAPWWLHKNHPALLPYVASRLIDLAGLSYDPTFFDYTEEGRPGVWSIRIYLDREFREVRAKSYDKARLLAALVALGEVSVEEARHAEA